MNEDALSSEKALELGGLEWSGAIKLAMTPIRIVCQNMFHN